jgi:hypothetical protein
MTLKVRSRVAVRIQLWPILLWLILLLLPICSGCLAPALGLTPDSVTDLFEHHHH